MSRNKNKKSNLLNKRSKMLGGYISKDLTNKNKSVEIYYREALKKELDNFFNFALLNIKEEYKPIKTKNDTVKTKNSISSLIRVFELLRGKYSFLFSKNIEKIVDKFFKKIIRNTKKITKSNVEDLFGKPLRIKYNKQFEMILKASIEENVNLIKNISRQMISNLEQNIYNSMTAGMGWKDIQDNLLSQKNISEKRAKKIARDQTAKVTANINQQTQQSLGIEYFEWKGMNDERQRNEHKTLNNKIFKWGDKTDRLPIIDKKGNRGYPGDAVLCRCDAKAVLIMDGFDAFWNDSSKSYVIKKINGRKNI